MILCFSVQFVVLCVLLFKVCGELFTVLAYDVLVEMFVLTVNFYIFENLFCVSFTIVLI